MKKLWDKLAKKNSKYFINSDYGREITEEQFSKSGREDYVDYIWSDELMSDKRPFLELGCGNGRILQHAQIWKTTLIGTDISGEMIKEARERVPGAYLVETDGMKLPISDNSIGVVFSYLVFQHMKTREMVESNFREVFRVLKPGGIFKVRIRTDEVKQDKWWSGVAYTEQSIGLLIKKMGYEILKTEAVEDYGLWLWLKKPIDMK